MPSNSSSRDVDMAPRGLSRRELLRRAAASAGLLFVPGLFAACGSDGSESTGGGPASIGDVSWGTNAAITNLDLRKEFGTGVAVALVQDALFDLDPDGRLVPALALDERKVDARTWVYKLRKATFSDGTPLTADDVAASLTASAREGSALANRFEAIASVEASGPLEVTVKLKRPTGLFRYALAAGPGNVTTARLATSPDAGTARGVPLGTGPYKIDRFAPGASVTYSVNPHFWGDKPAVERVMLKMIPDDAARLVAMQSKQLDGSFNVPSAQAPEWQAIAGSRLSLVGDLQCAALVFNTSKAPYDDVGVRKAVAYCWDRAGLVRAVLRGRGEVAATLPMRAQLDSLLPSDELDDLLATIPQYDQDLGAAREALAGSASSDGFSDQVTYPTGYETVGLALQALAESLSRIGIKLGVREVPLNQWLEDLSDQSAGIKVLITLAFGPDPSEKVIPYYSPPTPTGVNYSNYQNREVTALLDRAQATTDDGERGRLLIRAVAIAQADVPYAPLWWPEVGVAMKDELTLPGPTSFTALTPWAGSIRAAA